MTFPSVEYQLEYLKKGFAEIIREEDLKERLEESYQTGRPMRVKTGFDPTAPDLHLGHTVLIRKMKHFQDMGHTVIFLVGDITSLIGDPTGRNITRPPMTREEISANAETYKEQVFKILDPAKTEVRFNSEWFDRLNWVDVIRLASRFTVARILERDDFSKRLAEGTPISMHETLYPLAQGYDSVALECDIELGGTDQKFNLLVGRDLQRDYGQKPQIVATVPILEGLDGVEKMSKSKGNYVGIYEPPEVMVKKLMSISDDIMWRYFELLTDLTLTEIKALKDSGRNPRDIKLDLCERIAADFHGEEAGRAAKEAWLRDISQGHIPENLETATAGDPRLGKILALSGLASSGTEADRLVKSGAVDIFRESDKSRVDVQGPGQRLETGGYFVRAGKRWKRVIVE
ncbi:MAG TPA: tyrosine--tRNA ligase [Bryobacteraceae bacterium]|nr:tyrosine--tRNA ligase [Bryobacteraceae bacterium]HPT27235.1 tyrosine--tRNA ligase [Bryobacteraceae bacterium]